MKGKLLKIYFLGFLVIGLFFGLQALEAQEVLPKGSSDFESAVEIESGEYLVDREIEDSTYEFFKIEVKAGQALKIEMLTPASGGYAGAAIYNPEKEKVIEDVIIGEPNQKLTLNWLSNASGKFFLSIGNEYDINVKGAKYKISLVPYFDASFQEDAADVSKNALEIEKGEFVGYLAGAQGSDTLDFYKIKASKGETLTVKVIPQGVVSEKSKAVLAVGLYNLKGERVKEELAKTEGATVVNTVKIAADADVLIGIECDQFCSKELVKYVLEISSEKPEEGGVVTDGQKTPPPQEKDLGAKSSPKTNWTLIALIVILVLAAIIVLVLLLKKNKNKLETEEPKTGYLGGSEEANKPIVGYKHPCRYCGKLVPPDSSVCPYCQKVNPLGPLRCPKCHNPVNKDYKTCPHCSLKLGIKCPFCGEETFLGDYCEHCGQRLMVVCPNCKFEQLPLSDKCAQCGQPLKKEIT